MKRTIEVECPEGYNPVYKDGEIKFIKDSSVEDIKDYSEAIYFLGSDEVDKLKYQSNQLLRIITIIKALNKEFNNGNKISLTKNYVYYPYLAFYTEEKENSIKFKYDNKIYYLVGGHASAGSAAGVGSFNSNNSVGDSYAHIGLLGCATKEIAKYVSKEFPKLIFDALYWGKIDYEWID